MYIMLKNLPLFISPLALKFTPIYSSTDCLYINTAIYKEIIQISIYNEWVKKSWSIHENENYLVIKSHKPWTHAVTLINHKIIMLSGRGIYTVIRIKF